MNYCCGKTQFKAKTGLLYGKKCYRTTILIIIILKFKWNCVFLLGFFLKLFFKIQRIFNLNPFTTIYDFY